MVEALTCGDGFGQDLARLAPQDAAECLLGRRSERRSNLGTRVNVGGEREAHRWPSASETAAAFWPAPIIVVAQACRRSWSRTPPNTSLLRGSSESIGERVGIHRLPIAAVYDQVGVGPRLCGGKPTLELLRPMLAQHRHGEDPASLGSRPRR